MDMINTICSHNKKITSSYNETNGKICNCRNRTNCPLDNKCLTDEIFYKAEVETNDGIKELSTKVYQCRLETRHRKMIPNFQNIFGV